MLKKLFIATTLGLGVLALSPLVNLPLASQAQAESYGDAVKEWGKQLVTLGCSKSVTNPSERPCVEAGKALGRGIKKVWKKLKPRAHIGEPSGRPRIKDHRPQSNIRDHRLQSNISDHRAKTPSENISDHRTNPRFNPPR